MYWWKWGPFIETDKNEATQTLLLTPACWQIHTLQRGYRDVTVSLSKGSLTTMIQATNLSNVHIYTSGCDSTSVLDTQTTNKEKSLVNGFITCKRSAFSVLRQQPLSATYSVGMSLSTKEDLIRQPELFSFHWQQPQHRQSWLPVHKSKRHLKPLVGLVRWHLAVPSAHISIWATFLHFLYTKWRKMGTSEALRISSWGWCLK